MQELQLTPPLNASGSQMKRRNVPQRRSVAHTNVVVLACATTALALLGCSSATQKNAIDLQQAKADAEQSWSLLSAWQSEMQLAVRDCKLGEQNYEHFERAVSLARTDRGGKSLRLCKSLENLGELYLQKRRNTDAIACLSEAFELCKQLRPAGDLDRLDCCQTLARAYSQAGNFSTALALYIDALTEIRGQVDGALGGVELDSLRKLYIAKIRAIVEASLLHIWQNEPSVQAALERSLAQLQTSLSQKKSSYREEIVYIENARAEIARAQNNASQAIRLSQSVIESRPTDGLLLANAYDRLGQQLYRRGQIEQGLWNLEKACDCMAACHLEKADLRWHQTYMNLSEVELAIGDRERSQQYFQKAWNVLEHTQTGDNQQQRFGTLLWRTGNLLEHGDHNQARAILQAARQYTVRLPVSDEQLTTYRALCQRCSIKP